MRQEFAEAVLRGWVRSHRDNVTAWVPNMDGVIVVFNWSTHTRLAKGSAIECCNALGLQFEGAV